MNGSRRHPRAGLGLALAFGLGVAIAAPAMSRAKLQCDSAPTRQQLVLQLISATRGGVPLAVPAPDGPALMTYGASDGGDASIQAWEASTGTPPSWHLPDARSLRRLP
jgi:hypothetical protein